MVYGIICFATLFSFRWHCVGRDLGRPILGPVLGLGPERKRGSADRALERLILHARWGGLVRDRGIMNLAVFGNIVTSFSWFGVNMLQIGLHSYGFMDAASSGLMIFIVSQVVIIGSGLIAAESLAQFSRSPTAAVASASASQRGTAHTGGDLVCGELCPTSTGHRARLSPHDARVNVLRRRPGCHFARHRNSFNP